MTNFIELFEKRFTVLSNLRKLRSVASAPKTSRLVLEKLEPRRLLAVSAVDQIAAVVNNVEETAFVASPLTEQAPIDLSNVQDDGFATQEPLSSELLETETYVPETDCFNQTVTINNEVYVPFTMLPVRPVSFDNLHGAGVSEQGSFSYLGSVPDGLNSGGGSGGDSQPINLSLVPEYHSSISYMQSESLQAPLREGQVAFEQVGFDLDNTDYVTFTLPRIPDWYNGVITVGGTAVLGVDYMIYFRSAGSTVFSSVSGSNNQISFIGTLGEMPNAYIIPRNNASVESSNRTIVLTLEEPENTGSGGGDHIFTYGNTTVNATIIDDDQWKVQVDSDGDAAERLPLEEQVYGWFEFSRGFDLTNIQEDGIVPCDVSYAVDINFSVRIDADSRYSAHNGFDYEFKTSKIDDNDERCYLQNFQFLGSSSALTDNDGNNYYLNFYRGSIPVDKTTALLRVEAKFDWEDEGDFYSFDVSPDEQTGEKIQLSIDSVTWTGLNSTAWDPKGDNLSSEVEIKDGAILELYLDYNKDQAVDVEDSIDDDMLSLDPNTDDDNVNGVPDYSEGLTSGYNGVANEDDLRYGKLYAWIASCENYQFNVFQNIPNSSSFITLWNESNKATQLSVAASYPNQHLAGTLSESTLEVEKEIWIEASPSNTLSSLAAEAKVLIPYVGYWEYDGYESTPVSAYYVDLDVDSDNNGYVNTLNTAANGYRLYAEDAMEETVGKPITYIPAADSASVPDDYVYVDLRTTTLNENYLSGVTYRFDCSSNLAVYERIGQNAPYLYTLYTAGSASDLLSKHFCVKAVGNNSTGNAEVCLKLFKDNVQVAADRVLFDVQDNTLLSDWFVPSGWTIAGSSSSATLTTPMPAPGAVGPKTEGSGVITNKGDAVSREAYPNGFRLTLSYSFERNTTPGYFDGFTMPDTSHDEQIGTDDQVKMGFFGNSGVKFSNLFEIQIFDSVSLANLQANVHVTDAERDYFQNVPIQVEGKPNRDVDKFKDIKQTTTSDNQIEYSFASADDYQHNGGDGDGIEMTNKVVYQSDHMWNLISGKVYNKSEYSGVQTREPFTQACLNQSDINTMVISVLPSDDDYWVYVLVNGNVMWDDVVSVNTSSQNGDSNPQPINVDGKIYLQSHWGSGVTFHNVTIESLDPSL